MKKIYTKLGIILLALFPLISFAEKKQTLSTLSVKVVEYLSLGIYMIMAFAFFTFVWNVYQYFFVEKEKGKEAGMYILYSVIGFFVILSFWGLVNILKNTVDLKDTEPPSIVPIKINSDMKRTGPFDAE